MVVKQVFDHSLRAYGKRFISSLKASNRYSEGYLASLETSVAMAALYAEQQWPDVQETTTEHLEEYLAYLQDRTRWFGERTYAEPKKLSKGHINAQYRRLHRFFNWLVDRGPIDENPMHPIKPQAWMRRRSPWSPRTRYGTFSLSLTPPLPGLRPTGFAWSATGHSSTRFGTRRGDSPRLPGCDWMTWT